MSNPCMILDIAGADDWQPFHGCRLIEGGNNPTVLHPSREVAEEEALRLAARYPDRRFAIFELVAAATTSKIPTHFTLGGKVLGERAFAQMVEISEDDVPF